MTRERGGRREGSYGIDFALPDAGRKLEFEPKAKGQGSTQTQISQRRSLTGRPNEVDHAYIARTRKMWVHGRVHSVKFRFNDGNEKPRGWVFESHEVLLSRCNVEYSALFEGKRIWVPMVDVGLIMHV